MDRKFKFETARWSILSILLLTYILVYFHRMAPGVVSEYLMSTFGASGARLGALSAIYFFVYAAMQLPSGVLADTLGNRTSIFAGNLTAGVGSIMFGLAPCFAIACVGRFLVGLGVSVVFVGIMKNNAVWFRPGVFGLLSGLTLLIGNLGSVTAAGPLSALLVLFSWRAIFIGIGMISLLLAASAILVIRNRPEDLGFDAVNPVEKTREHEQKHWLKNLWSILKNRDIWPGFLIQFGVIGGLYSFMGLWAIPWLRDVQGLTLQLAARHLTVMLLSFAVGALFFGWLSDRLGRRKLPLIAGLILYSTLWAFHMFSGWAPGPVGLWLFGLLGFSGASFVITFAIAKEVSPPELSGMAVSVVNTGCFVGTALMQPLFGWIADRTWDGTIENGVRIYGRNAYQNGFLLMLAFVLMGLVFSFLIKETRCRNISGI